MVRSAARRTCSLVVVLALLLGPALSARPFGDGCTKCPTGCPMHVGHRLGCHRGKVLPCHTGAAPLGLRAACGRAADPAMPISTTVRGVMPAGGEIILAFATLRYDAGVPPVASCDLPEPPTDPPRAAVV